ncbi:MAG: AtpZ/AtpI family protein [Cyanobacteria bacterium]|nr:AtpZ/AtpI family protein [Cyanobacteriota bacterium]
MKDENKENAGGPPGWLVASGWGMSLVVFTCVLGFAGYFIGSKLGGIWSFILLMIGLALGFSLGIYKIYRESVKLDASQPVPSGVKPLDDSDLEKSDAEY